MLPISKRIIDILQRDQLISVNDLDRVIKEQKNVGGEISELLLKLKLISEDQLSVVLSEALDIPIINLTVYKIDPEVLKLIPKAMVEKYQFLPVSKIADQLTLAMRDPLNIFALDNVRAITGLTVNIVLARAKDIKLAIERSYNNESKETLDDILKDIKESEDVELIKEGTQINNREIEDLSKEAPIVTLTNTIIMQAITAKASDVFIEPLENSLRIRYRVDGFIREIDRMAKVLHFPIISRIKVISNLDIAEHRLPQDGRFRITDSKGRETDFRVSVLPTALGEKIVMRVLDKNLDLLELDKLGFEADSLARIKACCEQPHGLILACGPTGSGKTTTLYSVLKTVDSPGKNIITVEDPVEFQVKGFNQVNIRADFGVTFPTALRSILRQDPDVILIGEIRDSETMDIAVKAALTGHLVVSSLHTTTAVGSITRMINMGVEPFLLCSSVIAIIAQRLIRRLCPNCRDPYQLSKEGIEQFNVANLMPDHNMIFYRPKGCDKCFKSGYKGRVGITETLALNHEIKEMILAKASEAEIKKRARLDGMKTMREDAVIKACRGLTSLEEVVRLTMND